jgi:hypothetical protein
MSLTQYLKRFNRLRTDKNRKHWSALTTYQAPHKPFLLLSVMDLIAPSSPLKKKASGRPRIIFTGPEEIHFADENTNFRIFNKTSFF